MTGELDAIVFDLGNVLLEIDFERAFAHWSAVSGVPAPVIRSRWQPDIHVPDHEIGAISDSEFFAAIEGQLGLAIGVDAMAAGWADIFVGPIEPLVSLLPALSARLPVHVFSNTNGAHTPVWRERFGAAIEPHVHNVYLSHEIGRRKPDPDSFRWLATDLGIPPERLLFLDDSAINIAGAARAGLQTLQVTDARTAAATLRALLR